MIVEIPPFAGALMAFAEVDWRRDALEQGVDFGDLQPLRNITAPEIVRQQCSNAFSKFMSRREATVERWACLKLFWNITIPFKGVDIIKDQALQILEESDSQHSLKAFEFRPSGKAPKLVQRWSKHQWILVISISMYISVILVAAYTHLPWVKKAARKNGKAKIRQLDEKHELERKHLEEKIQYEKDFLLKWLGEGWEGEEDKAAARPMLHDEGWEVIERKGECLNACPHCRLSSLA